MDLIHYNIFLLEAFLKVLNLDTFIYYIYHGHSSPRNVQDLQNNINIFVNWSKLNNLHLNIGKCNFHSYRRKTHPCLSSYNIHGNALSKINSVRDLGAFFDPMLSFNVHIAKTCGSASEILKFVLKSSKYFNNMSLLKKLSSCGIPFMPLKEFLLSVFKCVNLEICNPHNCHITE